MVPKIGPHGQMVPNQFSPPRQMVPRIFGLTMRTKFIGDRLSRGINFIVIVCSRGQEIRDWKCRDQMGSGPNVSQPIPGALEGKGGQDSRRSRSSARYVRKFWKVQDL